jgi:hypothetical protein
LITALYKTSKAVDPAALPIALTSGA